MEIMSAQVQNGVHVVCQHLGKPVVVDVADLGSYVHEVEVDKCGSHAWHFGRVEAHSMFRWKTS